MSSFFNNIAYFAHGKGSLSSLMKFEETWERERWSLIIFLLRLRILFKLLWKFLMTSWIFPRKFRIIYRTKSSLNYWHFDWILKKQIRQSTAANFMHVNKLSSHLLLFYYISICTTAEAFCCWKKKHELEFVSVSHPQSRQSLDHLTQAAPRCAVIVSVGLRRFIKNDFVNLLPFFSQLIC